LPGYDADRARDEVLRRYSEGSEADIVDLRLVGTLFDTARAEGKVGERAQSALQRLFTDQDVTIADAYEMGAASNVELSKLLRDIATLPDTLNFGSVYDFIIETRAQLSADGARLLLDLSFSRAISEPNPNRKGVLLEVTVALMLSQVNGFEVHDVGISS
jgi:hypothetical protein